jgi:uncharacterized protein YgbK (DUF1537 family)
MRRLNRSKAQGLKLEPLSYSMGDDPTGLNACALFLMSMGLSMVQFVASPRSGRFPVDPVGAGKSCFVTFRKREQRAANEAK